MKPQRFLRLGLLALGIASASCGSVREGTGTSFLIVENMDFASGENRTQFFATLHSDVNAPTEGNFDDFARATFTLGLKDPGSAAVANTPTQNQFITIDRYHVRFFRADGRNTPGVDVPHEFDGAFTATVGGNTVQSAFVVVRHNAKREAPLAVLGTNRLILTIIAEITFYGRDQTGHETKATAQASIDFGNFVTDDE
jgi:hypothetical protein